jgi:hypothetical protein
MKWKFFLPIGVFSLVGALIIKWLGSEMPAAAFVEGVLLGLSVVFNLAYLLKLRSTARR